MEVQSLLGSVDMEVQCVLGSVDMEVQYLLRKLEIARERDGGPAILL